MGRQLNGSDYRSVLKRLSLIAACIALPVIAWAQWSTSGNDIYNTNSGKIGVGVTSPLQLLDVRSPNSTTAVLALGSTVSTFATNAVEGTISLGALYSGNSTFYPAAYISGVNEASGDSSYGALTFSTRNGSTTEKVRITSSGNVGIGTTAPSSPLTLRGGSTFSTQFGQFRLDDSGGSGMTLNLGVGTDSSGTNKVTWLQATETNVSNNRTLALQPYSGKVGIGTTTPSSVLEVVGDVTVSGNISAKYQDLAEWVSTTQVLPAGTVVVLDTEIDNGIVRSSIPYDTNIAGVVSDSPGIILGQAGPGKLKIATTGRVKVRVDTSNGPIQRGDLLVTGTREGTAMRSKAVNLGGIEFHRPGTLIGKALEPLDKGEGEILVLLSLQ